MGVAKCKAQVEAEEKSQKWGNDRPIITQKRAMVLNERLFKDRYDHLLFLQQRKQQKKKMAERQKNIEKTLREDLKKKNDEIKMLNLSKKEEIKAVKTQERRIAEEKVKAAEKNAEKKLRKLQAKFDAYKRKNPDYSDTTSSSRFIKRKRK